MQEIHKLYSESVKKSILDYVLMDESEKMTNMLYKKKQAEKTQTIHQIKVLNIPSFEQ